MSDFWSEELITDYLDDRLSPSDRKRVEAHLKANPTAADTLRDFQQTRAALRGSKKFELDSGFKDRVLQAVATSATAANGHSAISESPVSPAPANTNKTNKTSTIESPSGFNWRVVAIATGTLAASILLVAFLTPRASQQEDLARLEPSDRASQNTIENENESTVDGDGIDIGSGNLPPTPENSSGSIDSDALPNAPQDAADGQADRMETETKMIEPARRGSPLPESARSESEADVKKKMGRKPKNGQLQKVGENSSDVVLDETRGQNFSSQMAMGQSNPSPERYVYPTNEVLVVDALPSTENMVAIRNLQNGIQGLVPMNEVEAESEFSEEEMPATGSPTLQKRDQPADELSGGGRNLQSRSRGMRKNSNRPGGARRGGVESGSKSGDASGVDSKRSFNEPKQMNLQPESLADGVVEDQLENAYVFEVSATPEEFRQIVALVQGRQFVLDETRQASLLKRMRELDYVVNPVSGSQPGRSEGGESGENIEGLERDDANEDGGAPVVRQLSPATTRSPSRPENQMAGAGGMAESGQGLSQQNRELLEEVASQGSRQIEGQIEGQSEEEKDVVDAEENARQRYLLVIKMPTVGAATPPAAKPSEPKQ